MSVSQILTTDNQSDAPAHVKNRVLIYRMSLIPHSLNSSFEQRAILLSIKLDNFIFNSTLVAGKDFSVVYLQ